MRKTTKAEEAQKKKIMSVKELAEFVGVTERQIRNLQHEGVIAPESKGKRTGSEYDFEGCIKNIVRYYREKSDSRRSIDPRELASEKLRREAARRELDEIKVQQARGELHRADDIQAVFGAVLTRFRTTMLSLPMGLGPGLANKPAKTIVKKLEERIGQALYELSNFDFDAFKKNGGKEYISLLEKVEGDGFDDRPDKET